MCSKIREAKPFIHQMLDLIYDNIHLTNQQDINLLVLDAPDAVVLGRRTKIGNNRIQVFQHQNARLA